MCQLLRPEPDGRLGSSLFSTLTHPVSISKYIRCYHATSWSLPWHKPLPSLASCIGHACLSLLPTQQPEGEADVALLCAKCLISSLSFNVSTSSHMGLFFVSRSQPSVLQP